MLIHWLYHELTPLENCFPCRLSGIKHVFKRDHHLLHHVIHLKIQNFDRNEIWRVNIEANITKLSSPDESTERPKYSPDGLRIAYLIQESNSSQESPVYRFYVSNSDFSESILIERGLIQDYSWNSNSNEIIYSIYDRPNENFEIWKSSVSSDEKFQITKTNESEIELCFSGDGSYIAY